MSTPDPTPTDLATAQKYAAVRHYIDWALADADQNIRDNPLHPAYFRGKKSALGALKAFMDGLESEDG